MVSGIDDMTRRFSIELLERWIEVRFDRSSGPGGQNVNKLSTRATLLLAFEDAAAFDETQKRRIRTQLASRLARDGRLRVVSQRGRTQTENRRLAEARLLELLTAALAVRKRRRPTKPTAASRERRLKAKRLRGERKRQRGAAPPGDD